MSAMTGCPSPAKRCTMPVAMDTVSQFRCSAQCVLVSKGFGRPCSPGCWTAAGASTRPPPHTHTHTNWPSSVLHPKHSASSIAMPHLLCLSCQALPNAETTPLENTPCPLPALLRANLIGAGQGCALRLARCAVPGVAVEEAAPSALACGLPAQRLAHACLAASGGWLQCRNRPACSA